MRPTFLVWPHLRGQPPGSHCKAIPGSYAHAWGRSHRGPGCPLALHAPGCHLAHASRPGGKCDLNQWSTMVILGLTMGLRCPVLPARGHGGDARLRTSSWGLPRPGTKDKQGLDLPSAVGRMFVSHPNSSVEIPTPTCRCQERGLWEVIRVRGVPGRGAPTMGAVS